MCLPSPLAGRVRPPEVVVVRMPKGAAHEECASEPYPPHRRRAGDCTQRSIAGPRAAAVRPQAPCSSRCPIPQLAAKPRASCPSPLSSRTRPAPLEFLSNQAIVSETSKARPPLCSPLYFSFFPLISPPLKALHVSVFFAAAGDHHGAKAGASSSPWLPRSPAPPPASRRPSKASSALVSSNRSSHGCPSPFDPAGHRQPPPSAGSRRERVDPPVPATSAASPARLRPPEEFRKRSECGFVRLLWIVFFTDSFFFHAGS